MLNGYTLLAAVKFNQMKRQEIKQKIKECLQQFDGVDAPDDMVSETMFKIYGQELNAIVRMFEAEFKEKDKLYIQAVNGRREMRKAFHECRKRRQEAGSLDLLPTPNHNLKTKNNMSKENKTQGDKIDLGAVRRSLLAKLEERKKWAENGLLLYGDDAKMRPEYEVELEEIENAIRVVNRYLR